MRTKTITKMSDLMNLHEELYKEGAQWIWRGEKRDKPDWKLRPSVFRDERNHEWEYHAGHYFKQNAPGVHANCPTTDAEWLFLMQHHGLPTRLLDWSASMLTAAFFAVEETATSFEEDGVIWALQPGLWNKFEMGETFRITYLPGLMEYTEDLPQKIIAQAFTREDLAPRGILAIHDIAVSVRSVTQRSIFTLHSDPTPLEERTSELLVKLVIPSSSKKTIEISLANLGVSRFSLFQDLDGLSASLTSESDRIKEFRRLPSSIQTP